MAIRSCWRREYFDHPLAACIDNHIICIGEELLKRMPDYLAILSWLLIMSRRINGYCDQSRVVGDRAAEYWLSVFLSRCDCVANLDCIGG